MVRATYNFLKSVAFVSIMAGTLIYVLCMTKNHHLKPHNMRSFWASFVGSLSLLLESHGRFSIGYIRRRQEIFLFGLPRGLEIIGILIKKYYFKHLPNMDWLVFSIIIGVLHYYYQH
jgi:hypothetical protein